MELKYLNGVRITKLLHEMNPLEAAISRYEEQAKKHFSAIGQNQGLTQTQRQSKLKEALGHLENERRHLETIGDIQAGLEAYREAGARAATGTTQERKEAITMMTAESHHPTETLERYMRAEAVPKPSRLHTTHHILPGKGRHDKIAVNRARVHMHVKGIRINDPANGVYLLHKDEYTPHWTMPSSRGHLKYHTKLYEVYVSQKVRALSSMDLIKTQLQIIGRLLQENEPKTAIPKIEKLG